MVVTRRGGRMERKVEAAVHHPGGRGTAANLEETRLPEKHTGDVDGAWEGRPRISYALTGEKVSPSTQYFGVEGISVSVFYPCFRPPR